MRHRAWLAATVLTAVALLGGCADEEEQYCETLAEEQQTLTELADDSADGADVLTPTLESFRRLQAEAPEELQDEWDTLTAAYEALVEAVQAAGVDPAEYDPDKPPEDLSRKEANRLAAVASKLRTARVAEAAGGIQDHADQVCEVGFTG